MTTEAPHTWRPARFMVIAAHPDDADFGPAATCARWIDEGSVGWLVCCTSGDAGGEDPDIDPLELAATRGSLAHDEMVPTDEGIRRTSSRSGGTEGGMSTGEVLRVRAAMKPIATVPRALRTVDIETGEAAVAHHQRSDVCAVPAAGVVAEAMVALVLADAVLEKFGGDAVAETRRNVAGYLDTLRVR